jgi:hypothetical protein
VSELSPKAVALPFPLHCYDEAGLLKPPLTLYLICIWLCKALLLMIISVSMRENPSALIEWFYPDSALWYQNVLPAVPGVAALIGLSLRDKFRAKGWHWPQMWCKRLVLFGLLIQCYLVYATVASQGPLFNWGQAVALVISVASIAYLVRSKRVAAFVADARSVEGD